MKKSFLNLSYLHKTNQERMRQVIGRELKHDAISKGSSSIKFPFFDFPGISIATELMNSISDSSPVGAASVAFNVYATGCRQDVS